MNNIKTLKAIIIISIVIAISLLPLQAFASTNEQLVKDYCHEYYRDYEISYFTKWNEYKMTHRTEVKYVYVEIIKSHSNGGKYGTTVDGYTIAYNKELPKGIEVISYCIYSPFNNYCDDVTAVVDNNMIRHD